MAGSRKMSDTEKRQRQRKTAGERERARDRITNKQTHRPSTGERPAVTDEPVGCIPGGALSGGATRPVPQRAAADVKGMCHQISIILTAR